MAQTISVLEKFDQGENAWVVIDGHLFMDCDTAPQNTWFGRSKIGIRDKGLITRIEEEQAAARKHLTQGRVITQQPRTFEDRIVAQYREQVVFQENSARQKLLRNRARTYQRSKSRLEEVLNDITYADAYVGVKGNLYALHKQKNGPFRFRNKHYVTEHLGKTIRACALHEKVMRSRATQMGKISTVEGQELSTLQITHTGNNYQARLWLAPFALKTPLGTYAFDSCTIGYDFTKKSNGVAIRNQPVILHPNPYEHPFVFKNDNPAENLKI